MNHQSHFRLPRAPWWVGLALAATLPVRAEVTCTNQNPAIPATTPTADFSLHDDGTATHAPTGLMWMQCSLGQTWTGTTCTGTGNTYTWQNALEAAQTVNVSGGYAGHADWRLPNKNELASIVEERCWAPAINAAIFPGTLPDGWFWSSSPSAFLGGLAWGVNFNSGYVSAIYRSNDHHVRLVRGGAEQFLRVVLEDFESRDLGSIDGQGSWESPDNAQVVGVGSYEGERHLEIRTFAGYHRFAPSLPLDGNIILSWHVRADTTDQTGGYNDSHMRTLIGLFRGSAGNIIRVSLCRSALDHFSVRVDSRPIGNDQCIDGVGDLTRSVWGKIEAEIAPIETLVRVRLNGSEWSAWVDYGFRNAEQIRLIHFENIWSSGDVSGIDLIEARPGSVPINGQCGPVATDGMCSTSLSATLPGLCSAGEVFLFGAVSGGWTWSCTGTNGGAAATCSETKCLIPQ